MTRRRIALACALLVAVLRVGRASADEIDTGASALKKFEQGQEAFEAGRYADALSSFEDSHRMLGSPNSRLYVARCYARLGKLASAYTSFRLTAREANDRLVATGEKRYGLTRDAATAEQGDLEPRVARLTLAVPGGVPAGFVVKQNGRAVARAEWGTAVETDAGHIVVESSGPRMRPAREEFDLKDGEQRRVDVRVERVPTGTIALQFRALPPGVSVELDGAPLDVLDLDRPLDVDTGAHTLVVSAPGYAAFRWSKALANGQHEEVFLQLTPALPVVVSRGTPKWLFFGAAGGSVVALGVATIFAVRAQSLSTTEQLKTQFLRDPAARDTVTARSAIADVLFVTGAVFATGSLVLAFTTDWRASAPASAGIAIAPWLAPGSAGAAASGRF